MVTKSDLNSGKLFPTNMESILQALTAATPISNWKESTCTSTKRQVDDTCHERFLWILNLARWILCGLVRMDSSFVRTTSSLVNPEQATTGRKATTRKELNSSTPFLTSSEKKRKAPTVCKAFKLRILLEVALGQVWGHC